MGGYIRFTYVAYIQTFFYQLSATAATKNHPKIPQTKAIYLISFVSANTVSIGKVPSKNG